MIESKVILNILRDHAKVSGLTQAELSAKLGISLPTLKRWFSGKGISLNQVMELMGVIGVDFQDLSELVSSQSKKTFFYTLKQESYFTKNPHYLAYFDHLLTGKTPQLIEKKYKLNRTSTTKYLSKLERLGLIEVYPGDKSKLKVDGEPIWRKNGALSSMFKDNAIQGLVKEARCRTEGSEVGIYQISASDQYKVEAKLIEVFDFLRTSERRAKILNEKVKSFGCLTIFTPFSWSVLNDVKRL
jgi:transcriptional regulator with XRE-family HTH domain